MKKLNKLRLNDFQEMSEMEMKQVFGGLSGSAECTKKPCGSSDDCPGGFCANIGGSGINGCFGKYCM